MCAGTTKTRIENGDGAPVRRRPAEIVEPSDQLSMLMGGDNPLISKLKEMDINVLTPIDVSGVQQDQSD